jgi:hypothetical protein
VDEVRVAMGGRHGHPISRPARPMGSTFAGILRSTVGAWVKEGGNGKAGRREKAEGHADRQAEGRAGRQKGDGRYKARLRRKHLRHPVMGTGINIMECAKLAFASPCRLP